MKALFRMFTRNWGLKLLALALALVVYYSIRESIRSSGFSATDSMKGTFNDRPQNAK